MTGPSRDELDVLYPDRLKHHGVALCRSDRDGDCCWTHCPQLQDGEPVRSGRHCPLDRYPDDDD